MAGAFQSSAFQNNAFQTDIIVVAPGNSFGHLMLYRRRVRR